jgi:hypothetical protein
MNKEEADAHFKDFKRMGEKSVRIAVYSGEWRNNLSRLGAASEWLRLRDKKRESLRWFLMALTAFLTAISAVITARTAVISSIKYLLKQITNAP